MNIYCQIIIENNNYTKIKYKMFKKTILKN